MNFSIIRQFTIDKTKSLVFLVFILGSVFQRPAFPREVNETITRTLSFGKSKGRQLVVDNINGSIEVAGYDGDQVMLEVHKTISARSDAKVAEAKKKIKPDIREEGDAIILYVDAPYRRPDGSINHRGWRHYDYDVIFDFEIKVPQNVDLVLKTINDGEIKVRNTSGDFEMDNVNGGIEAIDIKGSGHITTVNGDVTVRFASNPQSDCRFATLNGEMNVTFLPDLSADFRIKTFNGEIYTDFDVTYLKARPATRKRKHGKFVYKSDKSFGVRVGKEGPVFKFDGFNGDIYIIKK